MKDFYFAGKNYIPPENKKISNSDNEVNNYCN
jgi:hypothetical protein